MQHHRLEHIELKIPLGATKSHRMVMAKHLHRHHGERLALGRVDFAGHDRGAGLILGDENFADAGARAGAIPAHVIGDFHGRAGQHAQAARGGDNGVMRREGGKFIGRRDERLAGFQRDKFRRDSAKIRMRVQPRAHRGAAKRQFIQPRQIGTNPRHGGIQLCRPARYHLPQRDRRGILQMRAPAHHYLGKIQALCVECGTQARYRRQQNLLDHLHRRDMHDRRETVIGGLAVVYVVVWVNRIFAPHHAAGKLDRAVGDHLIGVHVALGARTGLEDHERKLRVPSPRDHLLGRPHDQPCFFRRQLRQRLVGQRAGFFQHAKGANNLSAPGIITAADRKILEAALSLRTP